MQRLVVAFLLAAGGLALVQVPAAQEREAVETVAVELTDFEIRIPSRLPPGTTELEITNNGKAEHNIVLEGPGVDGATLDENLSSGESGSLRVELQDGEYYIWCPVGSHEDLGMHTTVTVAEAADEGAEPTTAESAERDGSGEAEESESAVPTRKHIPPRPADLQSATGIKRFLYWLGNFHPAGIAFPVALLVAAAMAELLFLRSGREMYDAAMRFCGWLGGASAVAAGLLGWCLAGFTLSDPSWMLTTHRWMGTGTAAWGLLLLVLLARLRRRPRDRGALRVVLLVGAVLVLATGFFGGAMIYGLDHYAWR